MHAVVVLRPDSRVTSDGLLTFARGHVAGYKAPKTVEFVDALPLTAVGKVDKKVLRAKFWAGQARNVG